MQRPRREEFILDVRRSARTLRKPNGRAESEAADAEAITEVLPGAALRLNPKIVEHYEPGDFAAWERERQDRLRQAVEKYRDLVGQASPNGPATIDQLTEGSHRLRDLINVLGEMIREEWMQTIETIEKQVEGWSEEAGWRTRRVDKKISESLIGTYEAPQLLIYAEPNLYVLDPVARFIPGGQGLFDLAIQPSYYTTSMYRDYNGNWFVHLDVRNGVSNGKQVEWSKDAFRQCIEQLSVLV